MYIPLSDVREHLLIDNDFHDDDNLLYIYIQAAEDAVEKYYGKKLSEVLEDGELPYSLKAALLLFIGHLYNNREATSTLNTYEIPLGYKHLLQLNNDYSTNTF